MPSRVPGEIEVVAEADCGSGNDGCVGACGAGGVDVEHICGSGSGTDGFVGACGDGGAEGIESAVGGGCLCAGGDGGGV